MNEYNKIVGKIVWWINKKELRNFVRDILLSLPDIKDVTKIKNELLYIKNEIKYINNLNNTKVVFIKIDNWWIDDNVAILNSEHFYLLKKLLMNKNIHLVFTEYNPDIEIFSVFGGRDKILNSNANIKIFYTGEAVKVGFKDYYDNVLDIVDLSLGFNHEKCDNYVRFPIWIWYRNNFNIFELNKDNIHKKVVEINNIKFKKDKFASLIARASSNILRKDIYDKMSNIDKISCPSNFMHNDDSLKTIFNDNKNEYLKQFKFNICPENCIEDGYITEKLFDAFNAGCIPIWSGDKNLEGDVINKDAILYWDENSDNISILKEIELLHKNDELYDKFVSQPRLNTDNATEYIYGQIKLLHEKIEELLHKKLNL